MRSVELGRSNMARSYEQEDYMHTYKVPLNQALVLMQATGRVM